MSDSLKRLNGTLISAILSYTRHVLFPVVYRRGGAQGAPAPPKTQTQRHTVNECNMRKFTSIDVTSILLDKNAILSFKIDSSSVVALSPNPSLIRRRAWYPLHTHLPIGP